MSDVEPDNPETIILAQNIYGGWYDVDDQIAQFYTVGKNARRFYSEERFVTERQKWRAALRKARKELKALRSEQTEGE